jgi:hypothetical protein
VRLPPPPPPAALLVLPRGVAPSSAKLAKLSWRMSPRMLPLPLGAHRMLLLLLPLAEARFIRFIRRSASLLITLASSLTLTLAPPTSLEGGW